MKNFTYKLYYYYWMFEWNSVESWITSSLRFRTRERRVTRPRQKSEKRSPDLGREKLIFIRMPSRRTPRLLSAVFYGINRTKTIEHGGSSFVSIRITSSGATENKEKKICPKTIGDMENLGKKHKSQTSTVKGANKFRPVPKMGEGAR